MNRNVAAFACLIVSSYSFAGEVLSFSKNLESKMVVKQSISPEAITISDDGRQVAFIAKTLQDFPQAPPTTAWLIKQTGNQWSPAAKMPWGGKVTSVSFANQDRWLVVSNSHSTLSGYGTIVKNLFGDREKIGDLLGFEHRIEIYDAASPKKLIKAFTPQEMGLKKPEMLKHARVSPDGKWMTFYTHGHEDQRGIYVYNFATKRSQHLGLTDDKHPTWTPDGTKILFHQQEGGNAFVGYGGEEKSLLGYYDLKADANDNLTATRFLMDSKRNQFQYHKHPSVYPGTDLVFFHGVLEPGSAKKLLVRRLGVDTKIFKISDIMINDLELKGTKHANSSLAANGLFFVAREKGKATTAVFNSTPHSENATEITISDIKDIYSISNSEVQKIVKFVNESDPK